MSIVLVLVAFALLMAIPAFLALGAVITAGGASLPGAPAPSDFGRDAVTVLGLSGGLYLLGVAMLVRVESRLLALAALVVAVVILGIALRDWLDAVERVGGAFPGSRWSHSAGSWRVLGPSHGSSSVTLTGGEQMAACPDTEPSRCSSASSRQGLMLDRHHG